MRLRTIANERTLARSPPLLSRPLPLHRHSFGVSLQQKPLIATPSLVFFCCEVGACKLQLLQKGCYTQLDQHLSHDRHEWPSILLPASNRGRKDAASSNHLSLLAIAACYPLSEIKLGENVPVLSARSNPIGKLYN